MNINPNTPVWHLTVGDLTGIIQQAINNDKEEFASCVEKEEDYGHGMQELADLLGISKTYAHILKNEKRIFSKEALIQKNGSRKITFNKTLILKEYKEWNS